MEQIQTASIAEIPAANWQQLFGNHPLLSQSYLGSFETSHCVGAASGWQPMHLQLKQQQQTLAWLPLYRKQHSYGEYVFDWSWARAYQSIGLDYYPKLITALPFTPSISPRLGLTDPSQPQPTQQILTAVLERLETDRASSWHLLFADHDSLERIQQHWPGPRELLTRYDCQFHWLNQDYQSFEEFLGQLRSSKRKTIRKERQRLHQQQIYCHRLTGNAITEDRIELFYQFYQHTYHQRGQNPYLSPIFFQQLADQMADRLLLVIAEQDQQPLGAALFIIGNDCLYGRWWGGRTDIDALHFEVCYYQGIEFAIDNRLARFDPGTQGEHKLIRGFQPIKTTSLHWLDHPALYQAVAEHLSQERPYIERYIDQARQLLPFRRDLDTGQ